MSRACFTDFGDLADRAGWDEATRRHLDGAVSPGDAVALCDECSLPLHRYAKLPKYSALLLCSRTKECDRCDAQILAGDMHFVCGSCEDIHICKNCGPGVYIEREYDYYDAETKEQSIQTVPASVLHERKSRQHRGVEVDATKQIASKVLQRMGVLTAEVSKEQDMHDKDWETTGLVFQLLDASSQEEAAASFMALIAGAQQVFASQPTVTEAAVPCKIFGDLHGQLRDLLLLFHSFGTPGTADVPNAVFNGDFVDRGKHQVEVVCVLFSLKILFPTQIWLNRGNHEDEQMNTKYGFQKANMEAFGDALGSQTFKAVSSCFEYLPVGCRVAGKVLAVHGGIGDGKWKIEELKKVQRPLSHQRLQEPSHKTIWNILWSDPIEDDQVGASVFGVHASPRSKNAVKFGWNVTQAFCAMNGLDLIVRSHQSKKEGLGFDVMHNEALVRVFSARDYEHHHNDGAVLLIRENPEEPGKFDLRAQVLRALS